MLCPSLTATPQRREPWGHDMKAFVLFVVLLLVIPMSVLNPMGRDAFLGYYAGVIATWAAYVFAVRLDRSQAVR